MPSFRLSSKQFWETLIFTPIFLFQGLCESKIFLRLFFLVPVRRIKLLQRHKIYFCTFDAVLFILPFINVIFITDKPTAFFNCHVYSSLPVVFIIVSAFAVFWSNDLCTFMFSIKSQHVTIRLICDTLRSWQHFKFYIPFSLFSCTKFFPPFPSIVYHNSVFFKFSWYCLADSIVPVLPRIT